MTAQEIFNRVWRHFVVEKNPQSYDEERDICMYRGPGGAKCAVGVIIPDDEYEPSMEGQYVDCLDSLTVKALVKAGHAPLLMALQEAHDRGCATDHALRGVAKTFGLEVPS